MADPFGHISPGDPYPFSATMHNELADVARERAGLRSQRPDGTSGSTALDILNKRGSWLEPYSVVGIGAAITMPDAADDAFMSYTGFESASPTAAGVFAITQDGIDDGFIGPALMSGITWVQVNITDAAHGYAAPGAGDYDKLVSQSAAGPAKILETETAGTGVQWCKVLLDTNNTGVATHVTGTSGSDHNIVTAGSTVTHNIPNADQNVRGLVFNGTQWWRGSKTFELGLTVGETWSAGPDIGLIEGPHSSQLSTGVPLWSIRFSTVDGQTTVSVPALSFGVGRHLQSSAPAYLFADPITGPTDTRTTFALEAGPSGAAFAIYSGVTLNVGGTNTTSGFVFVGGLYISGSVSVALGSQVTGDLPYANIAQAAAWTLLGNPTASTADIDDFKISALTEETTPATGDWLIMELSTGELRKVDPDNLGGAGSDTTAIHDNVAGEIAVITEKNSPVGTDKIIIEDSEASNAKKMVQISNIPAGNPGPDTITNAMLANFDGDSFLANLSPSPANPTYVQVGDLTEQTAPEAGLFFITFDTTGYFRKVNYNKVAHWDLINKTTSFTADDLTLKWYLADPAGGVMTATLPTVSGNNGLIIAIERISATDAVTIDGAGTETIRYYGSDKETITLQHSHHSIVLIADEDRNEWCVLSESNIRQYPDDVKITFNPGATNAGMNWGGVTSDPSSLASGDAWYRSDTGKYRGRIGTDTVDFLTSKSPGVMVQKARTDDGAVATGTTTIPLDDTVPQNTEGDQYLSQAITPEATSNKLHIRAQLLVSSSIAAHFIAALFQDSTAGALKAVTTFNAYQTGSGGAVILTIDHWMDAGTTSATTFKVRAGANAAGTTTYNGLGSARYLGGVMNSFIEITEFRQ